MQPLVQTENTSSYNVHFVELYRSARGMTSALSVSTPWSFYICPCFIAVPKPSSCPVSQSVFSQSQRSRAPLCTFCGSQLSFCLLCQTPQRVTTHRLTFSVLQTRTELHTCFGHIVLLCSLTELRESKRVSIKTNQSFWLCFTEYALIIFNSRLIVVCIIDFPHD